jgi:CheY-like chemotaxis protein
MENPTTIMIVDDVTDNRVMLEAMLEDDYQLVEAGSGKECLALVEQSVPDLILLDVKMPEMDGYEVCAQLRSNPQTRSLPVIFVSALDSSEERLAGFEAGGDEYITKPVDMTDLLDKVKYRLQQNQQLAEAHKQSADAMNMAMEMMTSSSELGKIIQFVKMLNEADAPETIAQASIEIIKEFGLNACVMVAVGEPIYVQCEPGSMEAKLLQQFQHHPERIVSAGARTIVRSEHLVVLIRDMPVDDENLYGRLKDHFAVLVEMGNNRLQTLSFMLQLEDQRKLLIHNIIEVTERQIDLTSEKIIKHSETVSDTMQSMLNQLENMLFGLGLDEDQEKALLSLADSASLKLEESNRSTGALDDELTVIIESLYELLEQENSGSE